MVNRFIFALSLIALAACTPARPIVKVQTVRVEVPVTAPVNVPLALASPYTPVSLPVFIAPTDPLAVVALDKAGADSLREVLRELVTRNEAWRAWAIKLDGKN